MIAEANPQPILPSHRHRQLTVAITYIDRVIQDEVPGEKSPVTISMASTLASARNILEVIRDHYQPNPEGKDESS